MLIYSTKQMHENRRTHVISGNKSKKKNLNARVEKRYPSPIFSAPVWFVGHGTLWHSQSITCVRNMCVSNAKKQFSLIKERIYSHVSFANFFFGRKGEMLSSSHYIYGILPVCVLLLVLFSINDDVWCRCWILNSCRVSF